MEIYGKIITALPERNGVSQRGNQWRSKTYVLETQEQYPKKLAFDVTNERIDQLNIQVGEVLTVQFDINAREYQNKWFNSVSAWNVVRQQPQGNMPPQGGYNGGQQGGGWTGTPQAGAQAAQAANPMNPNNPFPPQQPPAQPQGNADNLPF